MDFCLTDQGDATGFSVNLKKDMPFEKDSGYRLLICSTPWLFMEERKMKNIFHEGPIQPSLIAESIGRHQVKTAIGGHSIFLGQIRADPKNGRNIVAIEYTAYHEMALKKMDQIREDIFARYPIECMHVYHSLGLVKTGEICFFVFTSSAHRKAAMDACAETVERIKAELPIWGKEFFDDASYQWKENSRLK